MRGPRAMISGRSRLIGAAQHIAVQLALEIVGFGAVGNLELEPIAAHEALYRSKSVAAQMHHQLAVKKAVGLRAQPQFHRYAASSGDSVDRAAGERRSFERSARGAASAARSK